MHRTSSKFVVMNETPGSRILMVKGICHPASSDKSFPPFHLHSPYDFENAAKQIQEGIGACYEHEHEIGQCVDAIVTTDGLEVTMRVDPNINDTAKNVCKKITDGETLCMSLSHSYKRRKSQLEESCVAANGIEDTTQTRMVRVPNPDVTWDLNMKEVSIVHDPGRDGCIIKSAKCVDVDTGVVCASSNLMFVDTDGYKCIPEEGIVQRNSSSALIIMDAENLKVKTQEQNNTKNLQENEDIALQGNITKEHDTDVVPVSSKTDDVKPRSTLAPPSDEVAALDKEDDAVSKDKEYAVVEDKDTDEETTKVLQTAMQEIVQLREDLNKEREKIANHEKTVQSEKRTKLTAAISALQKELGTKIGSIPVATTEGATDNTKYVQMDLKDVENITTTLGSLKRDRMKSEVAANLEKEHPHSLSTKRTANDANLNGSEQLSKDPKSFIPKVVSNHGDEMYESFDNKQIEKINRAAANVRNGKLGREEYNTMVHNMAQEILHQEGGAVAANRSKFSSSNERGGVDISSALGYSMKQQNPDLYEQIVTSSNENTSSRLYASLV